MENTTSPVKRCKDDKVNESCSDERPSHVNPRLWEKYQLLKEKRQTIVKKREERLEKKTQLRKEKEKIKEAAEEEKNTNDQLDSLTEQNEKAWSDVKTYIHCNDHITKVDEGKYAAKGKLEHQIETALSEGDYEKAEKLSDKIATNEFGKVVADAMDAKVYAKRKKEEDERKKAKRLKKLPWTFNHKEKWESKSNM